MFKVGIIGLGHVAVHQIAALNESPEFQLAAGCDPDVERHRVLGKQAEAFVSAEEFLQSCDDLDVVVVASPNRLHVPHGIAVMTTGKWLLMEKPLAETVDDFRCFALRKSELSGKCTIALHAAFGVEIEWLCNEGYSLLCDAGKPTSIHSEFNDPYVEAGRLLTQAESLGGSWLDSGINALSVICRVVDPRSVTVEGSRMRRDAKGKCSELEAEVGYSFVSGSVTGTGVIHTSWLAGRNKKMTSLGFDGGLRALILDHSEQQVIVSENGESRVVFNNDNGLPRLTNHYIGVFSDLARQMRSGKDNFAYCQQLHDLLYEAENVARVT
jgi:D-galactose 1-dehydrogenase